MYIYDVIICPVIVHIMFLYILHNVSYVILHLCLVGKDMCYNTSILLGNDC